MPFWWMSMDDHKLFEKAKAEFLVDIRERPLEIFRYGVTSYVHTPEKNPMIKQINFKYNGKLYEFFISDIKITEIEP